MAEYDECFLIYAMDSDLPFYGFDEVEFENNRDVFIEVKMIYFEPEINVTSRANGLNVASDLMDSRDFWTSVVSVKY
ncbi:hypothetical protein DPMN_030281 [Dreissena polymorpha]|uniref:Uncharacterized protein n=1 Tax=Dreissena polymorpha TaxID=45954 RepID=A0A9D4M031_DREPO|nr:hypothetical protein DPMN_030281 [Dreissena polymorpha]